MLPAIRTALKPVAKGSMTAPASDETTLWHDKTQFRRHIHIGSECAVIVQTRKGKLFTNIVTPFAARLTLAAVLAGIWCNHVAYLHVATPLPTATTLPLNSCPRMTLPCLPVSCGCGGLGGNKYGASQVLVQIRAADAAPIDLDLNPTGSRSGGYGYSFNADVFFAVPNCRQHILDLAAPGMTEKIVGHEDPAQWGFNDLDAMWTG